MNQREKWVREVLSNLSRVYAEPLEDNPAYKSDLNLWMGGFDFAIKFVLKEIVLLKPDAEYLKDINS